VYFEFEAQLKRKFICRISSNINDIPENQLVFVFNVRLHKIELLERDEPVPIDRCDFITCKPLVFNFLLIGIVRIEIFI